MNEKEKKPRFKNTTIVFMVVVAIFFDVLQWLLAFIFMGWMVSIFAVLTFYLWFRLNGVKFVSPKRIGTLFGGFFIEIIPILNVLPAWTAAVTIISLDAKVKEKLPVTTGGKVLPFKPNASRENQSTDEFKKAA